MSELKRLDDDDVAELVRRSVAGDEKARDALLKRCHGTVYHWALVQAGDPDDAEDVAQEVLVLLHTKLDRYRGESRFSTWLYQVTRNAARTFWRRLASRARLARAVAREPRAARENPLDRLAAADTGALLAGRLRQLPERQREILYLSDVEGIPTGEIAAWLGLSPATVRVHLCRARRALRAWILKDHPEVAEERG